jgi:hypothetical protein
MLIRGSRVTAAAEAVAALIAYTLATGATLGHHDHRQKTAVVDSEVGPTAVRWPRSRS